ncbi:MAG: adenylate/guanylate cyclase domain-containing protein [Treponemataceae bacterium]
MKVKFKIIALILLVITPFLFARNRYDNLAGSIQTFWNDMNGLPSDRLLDVIQDETGYIWLASYDGLIRFNGSSFTKFTKELHGFTGVSPRVFCVGDDNSLWIGTNASGLYKYKDGSFTHYGLEEGLPNLSVRSIKFDNKNTLWIGTAGGVAKLDPEGKITQIYHDGIQKSETVFFVLPVKDYILVGTNLPGLKIIKDEKMYKMDYLTEIQGYSFSSAFLDFDSSVWLGTNSGRIFNIGGKKLIKSYTFKSMDGMNINKFLRVKDGTMYVGTEHGIIRILQDYSEIFTEENGLPNNMVSGLFEDRESNLWISMEYGGLGKFTRRNFFDVTKGAYLPEENINSVLEDKDKNLWLGGDSGLSCIKSEKISKQRALQMDSVIDHLNGIRIRQIREEDDGTIYFSTYSDKGLVIFSKDGTITSLTKNDGLPNNKIRFSYRDSFGCLWVGTTAGPAIYHGGKMTTITQEQGLPNLFLLSAIQTEEGQIWLGTDGGGAVRISASFPNGNTNTLPELKVEEVVSKKNGLIGNIVFRITEDKAGNLWFCTSEGLSLCQDGVFYSAASALDITGQSVYNILCDSKGNLWIMLPNELLLVRSDSLTSAVIKSKLADGIIKFNKLDGLSGQPAANAWAHLNETDTLFVPTLKGVSVCDPSYDVFNRLPPPVVVENIFLDDKPLSGENKKINVPADTKRIVFKFAALSYTVPQRINFQYKLEGYDKEWITTEGPEREIGYTNLFPKNYTFKIRAKNNDGIINMNGAEIAFHKKPKFYQTVWFYLVVLLGLSGLIVTSVKLKIRNLEKRAKILDEKVKEKTKDLEIEKEKSDKLLKNTLPLFVIDELKQTGKSAPRLYPSVTIMFADLADFTEWSSRNSAEHVINSLNKMFTHFDNIIERYGCERIKTLGDGYMACCGLRGEEDHAQRIVSAAIEMLTLFDDKNTYGTGKGIHIGISSGPITGGIVGEQKYIFDIFGDTVNTAFRLESVTVPMGCTVSKNTAELIQGKFKLLERPDQELKGKGKVSCYYIAYKNNDNSQITDKEQIKNLYKELANAFSEKDYKQCKKLVAMFDKALLEPEQLLNIEKVEKIVK